MRGHGIFGGSDDSHTSSGYYRLGGVKVDEGETIGPEHKTKIPLTGEEKLYVGWISAIQLVFLLGTLAVMFALLPIAWNKNASLSNDLDIPQSVIDAALEVLDECITCDNVTGDLTFNGAMEVQNDAKELTQFQSGLAVPGMSWGLGKGREMSATSRDIPLTFTFADVEVQGPAIVEQKVRKTYLKGNPGLTSIPFVDESATGVSSRCTNIGVPGRTNDPPSTEFLPVGQDPDPSKIGAETMYLLYNKDKPKICFCNTFGVNNNGIHAGVTGPFGEYCIPFQSIPNIP